MQSCRDSPDNSDQELKIGAWLKPFFGFLCYDLQEVEDCLAFDIMPDAPKVSRVHKLLDYVVKTDSCCEVRAQFYSSVQYLTAS